MQLHISHSIRSITISSSKVAAHHIFYRTLFHTILILAFLLPFVFILTALVTLEGANKCSSIDCLGRRLGPRLLGRADDSQRLARDFYKILNEVSTQDIPDGLKLPDSFNHLVSDTKNNHYDAKTFALVLRAMMEKFERGIRETKFAELTNKHFERDIMMVVHMRMMKSLACTYSENKKIIKKKGNVLKSIYGILNNALRSEAPNHLLKTILGSSHLPGQCRLSLTGEGSNLPCTAIAVDVLRKANVLIAHAIAAGAGGVAAGEIKVLRESNSMQWSAEDFESRLQTYEKALKAANDFGYQKETPEALLHGATIAPFLNIAQAITDQDCV